MDTGWVTNLTELTNELFSSLSLFCLQWLALDEQPRKARGIHKTFILFSLTKALSYTDKKFQKFWEFPYLLILQSHSD